jgi:hypothetical protein
MREGDKSYLGRAWSEPSSLRKSARASGKGRGASMLSHDDPRTSTKVSGVNLWVRRQRYSILLKSHYKTRYMAEGTGFEPSVPRDTTNLSTSPLVPRQPKRSERKRTDTRSVGLFPRGTDVRSPVSQDFAPPAARSRLFAQVCGPGGRRGQQRRAIAR